MANRDRQDTNIDVKEELSDNTVTDEDDLIVTYGENAQAMVDAGVIDADSLRIRDEVNSFDPKKLDKYCEPLLYRAYYVAKNCRACSYTQIAKGLGMSKKLFSYYMETYPKFATVVQIGINDCRENMKGGIIDALYSAALGQTVTETSKSEKKQFMGDDELPVLTITESSVTKHVPPNVQAALELMKRLDPSWVPQVNVNVDGQVSQNIHVAQDINIAVDYDKLSPEALKELIESTSTQNDLSKNKKEDGSAVRPAAKHDTKPSTKPRRHCTARKLQNAITKTEKEVDKIKKAAKKEADKLVNEKENEDGNRKAGTSRKRGSTGTAGGGTARKETSHVVGRGKGKVSQPSKSGGRGRSKVRKPEGPV